MKRRLSAMVLALMLVFGASFAVGEAAEVTGESFVGNWAVTKESLETVLEVPEGAGETVTVAITLEGEFYDIVLDWAKSATEKTTWLLMGSFDPENEALYGYGTKTHYILNEKGEAVSAEIENEEVNAEFTFVENGLMNWRDSDEGIDGVLFEKVIAEAAD
jgi:hypothetical protein